MIAWLESLPTLPAGLVIIGGFVLSTLVLGYLVSASTSREVRSAHTDRAGFILAVIGVIYAVLLAFVAVGVWERFDAAEARTVDEAGALATLYRDAGSFPKSGPFRATLRLYVRSIIGQEFPAMRRGERSGLSDALIEAVAREVRALPASPPRLQNLQAEMLAAADSALSDRETRLTIDITGINGIMWIVLIIGAYLTVGFTYLFGFDKTVMQQLMVGGLSLMIGLVLFLVLALDYPFRGAISVAPDAFTELLTKFSH
jgi:hypothetical protein